MSWQRILEMARRQGMPLIVTDIAGREPMVVLPFEAYEMLAEAGMPAPSKPVTRRAPRPVEPAFDDQPVLEDIAASAQASQAAGGDPMPKASESGVSGDALTLEERFYLEPVEET